MGLFNRKEEKAGGAAKAVGAELASVRQLKSQDATELRNGSFKFLIKYRYRRLTRLSKQNRSCRMTLGLGIAYRICSDSTSSCWFLSSLPVQSAMMVCQNSSSLLSISNLSLYVYICQLFTTLNAMLTLMCDGFQGP